MRETVADYGEYEITRHLASGEYEVWSATARIAVFHSEARARQWAAARAKADADKIG